MSDNDLGAILHDLKRIRGEVGDLIARIEDRIGDRPGGPGRPSVTESIRIATERAVAGGSIRSFAARAGVDHVSLSRFLKNEKSISGATVDRLAAFLKLELHDIGEQHHENRD